MLLWLSDSYRDRYPDIGLAAAANRLEPISSSTSTFYTLVRLGGIDLPTTRTDSLAVVSPHYTPQPAVYMSDHDDALPLADTGMTAEDFRLLSRE
jgi:hypothetical protein